MNSYTTMIRFVVETYASEGNACDPEPRTHDTLDEAAKDASGRIGKPVDPAKPDWLPEDAIGGWHESEADGCGGVTISRREA